MLYQCLGLMPDLTRVPLLVEADGPFDSRPGSARSRVMRTNDQRSDCGSTAVHGLAPGGGSLSMSAPARAPPMSRTRA